MMQALTSEFNPPKTGGGETTGTWRAAHQGWWEERVQNPMITIIANFIVEDWCYEALKVVGWDLILKVVTIL